MLVYATALNLDKIIVQRPLCRFESYKYYLHRLTLGINVFIILGFMVFMTQPTNASDCMPYQKIDDNDVTINDILIKGTETEWACVKARFALAFKIEEKQVSSTHDDRSSEITTTVSKSTNKLSDKNVLIGYVRIGNAIRIEHTCPKDDNYNVTSDKTKSFLMTIEFECGLLHFTFERDEHKYSLSNITGFIRFGSSNLSQQISITQRMFITSDLKRHFFCPDKVEVDAKTAEPSKYEIQANFWNSEFETFRLSSDDRFILPKDEESVPIENGPKCPTTRLPEKRLYNSMHLIG